MSAGANQCRTPASLLQSLGRVYTPEQSARLLATLMAETPWQRDYVAFGRRIDIPRLQAWFADAGIHYRYSDNQLNTCEWNPLLSGIKQHIEQQCGYHFNSVLLTCYRDGNDEVGWHADDEAELGEAPVIASLSLGASRRFRFRHKHRDESGSLLLHDAELLIMHAEFQHDWQHAVPAEPGISQPRLNLTFRKVVRPEA